MSKGTCPNCGKEYGMFNQQVSFENGSEKCSKCTTIKERMNSLQMSNAKQEMKKSGIELKNKTKELGSEFKKAMNVSTDGKCPKCASTNIQLYSDRDKKSFGVGTGLCGGILLGPVGLLCGFCGNKDKSKTGRMCINCGNKF